MRDMERKRARDRARMARLYAEGRTWWQTTGAPGRVWYDMHRAMARGCVRGAADETKLARLSGHAPREADLSYWADAERKWKQDARDSARRAIRRAVFEREHGP